MMTPDPAACTIPWPDEMEPPEDDPEVAALGDIVAALADLPTATRARIARYVFERYDGVVAS